MHLLRSATRLDGGKRMTFQVMDVVLDLNGVQVA